MKRSPKDLMRDWKTWVNPAELHPAPDNPRLDLATRYPEGFATLKASILEGWFKPVCALTNGEIVCGHQRVKAALSLGIDVPVLYYPDDLTEKEKRRIRLADNGDAWGFWDKLKLQREIGALSAEEVKLTGVDPVLVSELTTIGGPPAVDEPPQKFTTWKVVKMPVECVEICDSAVDLFIERNSDPTSKKKVTRAAAVTAILAAYKDQPDAAETGLREAKESKKKTSK